MADLGEAQARAVGGHKNRAVLGVRGLLDERCHFLARENLRQLLRLASLRNLELRLGTLERHTVEESNALRGDVAARPGELALANQVKQVALNLLLSDVVWTASIVLRKLRHRPDIRLACPLRHATDHEIALHLLAQNAHRRLLVPMHGNSPATERWHDCAYSLHNSSAIDLLHRAAKRDTTAKRFSSTCTGRQIS